MNVTLIILILQLSTSLMLPLFCHRIIIIFFPQKYQRGGRYQMCQFTRIYSAQVRRFPACRVRRLKGWLPGSRIKSPRQNRPDQNPPEKKK